MKCKGDSVRIRNFLPQWYHSHMWDGKPNGRECYLTWPFTVSVKTPEDASLTISSMTPLRNGYRHQEDFSPRSELMQEKNC